MRIRRILIPTILALSTAGSIMAGATAAAATTHASSAHVSASAPAPNTFFQH